MYHQLNELNEDARSHGLFKFSKINLCVGKEWYRFPSSFFLPERLVLLWIFILVPNGLAIRTVKCLELWTFLLGPN